MVVVGIERSWLEVDPWNYDAYNVIARVLVELELLRYCVSRKNLLEDQVPTLVVGGVR